jgi:hypothetical protein
MCLNAINSGINELVKGIELLDNQAITQMGEVWYSDIHTLSVMYCILNLLIRIKHHQ